YQAGGKWRDLIEVLRNRIDVASSDAEAVDLLSRVAEIHEHKLGESDEAIAAWLEVSDRDPDAMVALVQLARLYRASSRRACLLAVIERQAALADGPEKLGLEVGIAELLAGPL